MNHRSRQPLPQREISLPQSCIASCSPEFSSYNNCRVRPLLAITVAINEVVVVFPCAPATSIPYFILASSASISALGITGIAFLCLNHLSIVLRNSRGYNHNMGVVDIFRSVPDIYLYAETEQLVCSIRLLNIRACNFIAEVMKDPLLSRSSLYLRCRQSELFCIVQTRPLLLKIFFS